MNKIFKRIASVLLFGLMLLSMMPAMAAGIDDGNLITNGGFENGLTGWNNLTQDNLYSADSANIYEGSYSAYFPQGSTFSKFSGSVTAQAGVPYIASYMAKAVSGTPSVMLAVGGLAGSDGVAPFFTTTLETPSPTLSSDSWKNACYTFCSPTQKNGVVYLLSWGGIANPIYFDNFYIGELKIADLEYTGSTNPITVPAQGIESTLELSAKPSNQLGTGIGLYTAAQTGNSATYSISWEPAEDYAGVSIDGSTLKVTSDVTVEEIQVVATATLQYPGVPTEKRTSYQETFTFELTQSAKPEAKGISFSGAPYLGKTLTASYTYFNGAGVDEFGSEYQWEISATGAEPFSPITGATSLNLAIEDYMIGQYVRFTVIPKTAEDQGDLTKSDPVRIYTNAKDATNLLVNGGFEDGLANWPATSEVTSYSADSANVFEGNYSAYAGRGATWADFDQPFYVQAGKTYIASYMAKSANSGSTPNAMIILENLDGADVAPYFKSSLEPQNVALNSTSWSNVYYTFTPKSTFETSPFIVAWSAIDPIYIDDFFVGELLIDDIKFTGRDTMVTVPTEGSTTLALAAEPYNQLGTKGGLYTAAQTGGNATYTMSWELADTYEGVTLDGSTLTISSAASAEEVDVTAVCVPNYTGASQENFTKTFTITLDRAERPEARGVEVTGTAYVGQTLDGHYTYFDVNGHNQQGTTFSWEICGTENGEFTAISNETGESLTLTPDMANQYVRFCVTPRSTEGVGKTIASDPVFVYADLKSATNLIENGNFESGLSGWNVSSNVTSYSADSANIYEGSYSAYLANGAKYTDFLKKFNVTQGKTYIASYMAKAASGTPSVVLSLKNLANAAEGAPYYGTALEPNNVVLSTDTWKNVVCTFTPKSSFESELYIPSWVAIDPIYVDDIFVGELFIDDIQFTGNRSAVSIPLSGKTSSLTLSAVPCNQLGTTAGLYSAEQTGSTATYEMTWALKEAYTGVSLEGANLIVSPNVSVDEIQVEATCTPKYAGAAQENFKKTFTIDVLQQQIPVASDVHITGTTAVDHYLTGHYTYFDINDDVEDGSVYEWKICDTENGTYSAISGADTNQLKITSAMRNKYIKFYVTPKNAYGAGVQKKSNAVFFFVDPTKDGNADLSEILVDGTPINNFKASRTTYDIEIPYEEGMLLPVVSATAKNSAASVVVTQAADFSSPAEVVVTSENCAYVKEYIINFTYTGREELTSENLVINGGFENGLNGWNANTGTVSVNEDAAYVCEGEKSALQSNSAYTDFNYNVTLTGGKTYLFSFKAKAAGSGHKLVGSVDGFNENGQAPFRDVLEPQWMAITADKWYTYNMTYCPTITKNGKIYITNWTSLPDTYIDDVYLGELLISDLQYKGKTTLYIPQNGEESIYLTAVPFNQLGTQAGLYSAEEAGAGKATYQVIWELAWDCPGVTINGNKLTVSSTASQENLEIKAICKPLYPGALQTEYVKRFTIELIPHDDPTPRALNVTLDGILAENEVLMAGYTFYQVNSELEGESVYKWYYADSENGPYTEIAGENGLTYTVRREHVNGFIKFGVRPVTEGQMVGQEVRSNFVCAKALPVASNLTVTGVRAFNQFLTGSYTYSDLNNDAEAGTTVKWRISDTANGTYTDIPGATTKSLQITSSMKNKYVIFCVTPKNALETGAMVSSNPILVAAVPTIENLEIVRVSSKGNLYRVEYDYVHPCGAVAEGATKYEWLVGGTLVSTGAQFDATGYESKTLTVRVTPVASLEPAVGETVSKTMTLPREGLSNGGAGGLGGRAPGGSSGGGGISVAPIKPQDTPVVTKHWAQDAIDFVAAKGIMTYPETNNFKVDELVTRADFIYFVAKAIGLSDEGYQGEFKDVASTDYYASLLQSAVNAGIISKDENFYPGRHVSREEICKIITLAANVVKGDAAIDKIDRYADKDSMAEWALPYIGAALDSGLLIGVSETEFMPKGMVTRGQTAVIIKRIMDSLA